MSSADKKLESIKERLRIYSEILRNLVLLLVAVGGGSIGLLFKASNPVSIPLIILGLILSVGLIFGIVRTSLLIKETLEELRKWERKS